MVGTGKSSAAARLADRVDGVVIASDRVRKQLAGLAPTDRDPSIYTPERTQQVYEGLCERALPVVESGRTAVLDATHARADQRAALRRFAQRMGLRVFLLETACARDVVLERLRRRAAQDRDPSDAGPEFYAESAAHYEPPDEWPAADRASVRTDAAGWERELDALARRVREQGAQ
jgi:predicted kinase